MPDRKSFAYSFAHYAELVDALLDKLGAKRFAIYLMDYVRRWLPNRSKAP
jgi:hypothetical protein